MSTTKKQLRVKNNELMDAYIRRLDCDATAKSIPQDTVLTVKGEQYVVRVVNISDENVDYCLTIDGGNYRVTVSKEISAKMPNATIASVYVLAKLLLQFTEVATTCSADFIYSKVHNVSKNMLKDAICAAVREYTSRKNSLVNFGELQWIADAFEEIYGYLPVKLYTSLKDDYSN